MTGSTTSLRTEMVAIPRWGTAGCHLEAYRVLPAGSGPFPGVVIIHEILGLNANIRDIAQRFADAGYAALAVDLFSGGNRAICLMRIFYGILLRPLNNGTVADLRASIEFLRAQPDLEPARIGVIGFCMGGSYARQLACVEEAGRLNLASMHFRR